MSDPKYSNLPGIAIDQPDCYETPDVPEIDNYSDYQEGDEDNTTIERIHLNPELASERFRGKVVDGSNVDFSDRITKARRHGYDAQTLWELAPFGEPETTLQKFLRLKCEVQELVNEIQTNGLGGAEREDPNLKTEEILKDAKTLQGHLLALKVPSERDTARSDFKKKLDAKLVEMGSAGEKVNLNPTEKSDQVFSVELFADAEQVFKNRYIKSVKMDILGALAQRVARLEAVLGSEKKEKLATVAVNPKNRTILGSLSVLNSRFGLLEPNHIDLLENRLSSVLQKVTKIAEKKLDVQELERTLKLSDLYDLMEESSETIQALPELAVRLRELRTLHLRACGMVKDVAEIKSMQESVANATVQNEVMLKELNTAILHVLESVDSK